MRPRQLLLTFGALATAWIGLATQHGSRGSRPALRLLAPQPASEAKASAPKAHKARARPRIRAQTTVRPPAKRPAVAPLPEPSRRWAVWDARKRARAVSSTATVDAAHLVTPEPPPAPPPPTEPPPAIVDAHVVAVTTSTARIRWQTNAATR